jgi:hypothetical protein
MTTHYQDATSEFRVWLPGADPATDSPDVVIPNDGSGFENRKECLAAIEATAVDEFQSNGWNANLLSLLQDAIFENFEEVEP